MSKNDIKKFIIYSSSGVLILGLSVSNVLAQNYNTPTASNSGQSIRLTNQHQRCDNQIEMRITSLNNLSTRLNEMKKLSSDQKTQLTGEIQTDISGLTALKVKCDADTDLQTLLTDTKSIYTTYRIYAVFEPQSRILAATDRLGTTIDQFNNLINVLQTKIQNAGNPSNLTSLLSDMQSKVNDAKTQSTNAQNLVLSLTPQSYNSDPTGTKNSIKQAITDIKNAIADLKAAWADAKSIRQSLGSIKNVTSTPTPTI